MKNVDRPLSRRDLLRGLGALGVTAAASRVSLASTPTRSDLVPFHPVRFAVIGDWGNGSDKQFRIADCIARVHGETPVELVLSAGDNIYPDGDYEDFGEKFERPYEKLIRQQVPFYTVFGNHDVRKGRDGQLRYPLFNMRGRDYYTVQAGNGMIEFFMLDSTAMDDRQVAWFDRSLTASTAVWKVVIVHHPPFSSGKKHGSDKDIRRAIHPLIVRHKVAAVFSGDDHLYQRVTLQDGVQYFVTGAAGKIRYGNLDRDDLVAAGKDDGNHFMIVEASLSGLTFKALDSHCRVFDSGEIVAPPSTLDRFIARFAARGAHAG